MDNFTQKVNLVCGLQKEEDWWYFYFGHKDGSLVYSPKLLSREIAEKMMGDEINQTKNQYGSDFEVIVERKDL